MANKVNKHKNMAVVEQPTVNDIDPFWDISEGWVELPYDKKCERYWKFEYVNGSRMFPKSTSSKSKV